MLSVSARHRLTSVPWKSGSDRRRDTAAFWLFIAPSAQGGTVSVVEMSANGTGVMSPTSAAFRNRNTTAGERRRPGRVEAGHYAVTLRGTLQCEISRCDQCDRLPAVAFDEAVFETVLAIAANGGAVLHMPPEAPL